MPLHIDVRANDFLLDELVISRLDDVLYSNVQVSQYEVLSIADDTKATFQHKYSDGPLVCLRKAIEALEAIDVV